MSDAKHPNASPLRTAMRNGRLQIFAQRILPLRDLTRTAGIECLPRLLAADGSITRPADLLAMAGGHELLMAVEEWTIDQALTALQPYASMLLDEAIQVAFPLSEASLRNDEFLQFLETRIGKSDVLPTLIAFQINESVAARNLARMDSVTRRLRSLGCRIALDEFGTRVVSLAHLQSFRPHHVKVAGDVVRNVLASPDSEMMLQTIVELAEALQVECVAKHVVSDMLVRKLRELGVGYAQGNCLHEVEPLASVLDSLDEQEQQHRNRL